MAKAKRGAKAQPVEITLDKAMQDRIVNMARQTWQRIGFECIGMNDGKALPAAEVIECVADCEYMRDQGGDREAFAVWNALPMEQQDELMRLAFPLARYGM